MEEKEKTSKETSESSALYYGIGAAILVILVAGIYMLRPKTSPTPTPLGQQTGGTGAPIVRPTGPITGLACEVQYYNPVIGRKQYYLSAEGSDVSEAKSMDCVFTASVAGRQIAKTSVEKVNLSDEPNRGGKTFICTTEALELDPSTPTVVEVQITDDLKKSASCAATFLFPAP